MNLNPIQDLQFIGAILKDISTFEGKKPLTVAIPASTTEADLSEYGLGTVRIEVPAIPITITKLT